MRQFDLLVVDDNREYLNLIHTLFELAGLRVLSVGSGEDALQMIREKPIGLIFTDYNMPGMDGLELAARVREIVPYARIVMITTDPSPKIIEMAMKTGISKVAAKPFNLKHIRDIMETEKQWMLDSLKGTAIAHHPVEQNDEEKPPEKAGKEESHGKTSWVCPRCGARHFGWSELNVCSNCGGTSSSDGIPGTKM